ncbi:DUF6012 family protein [Mixta intestinalis]|uniref:Uncharacterized protein n=1 Tax=Mixta intestinalis TaxID=1615494 RepID=A0A6P1Q8A7_9GAMM|nr:DUF6012 family protein [Mixta intestinalis]QHM74015.1 hypothetical protein C7M51_04376 [Mixta intestinalis]
MLIHLTPSYFLNYSNISVNLIDVEIPELGLRLQEERDITVRFPSPNKRLHYVCRKKGRKAVKGILLNTDKHVSDITVITRWAVQGDVSVHRVHMHIVGNDDAATDLIQLWSGFYNSPYGDKTPEVAMNWIPASCQPRLTVNAGDRPSVRETAIWRRADPAGIIRQQTEYYTAATVEPERLISPWRGNKSLPALEDAFDCKVRECSDTLRVLFSTPGVTVCPVTEQEELIKNDLKETGRLDAFTSLIQPVMQEVRTVCPVFFTNTNNLMNVIRQFSSHFRALTDSEKHFVESQINQPLFQVD